jgi:ABC-type nitrate/sulfonate/bicarbonate transport system substrate-binding protein
MIGLTGASRGPYPPDISSFGGRLVVSNGFLSNNRDVVAKVVHALLEALALCLGGRNKAKVMQAFNAALSINRRRKRCKQFRRAATQAVSFIGAVGKDADSDIDP